MKIIEEYAFAFCRKIFSVTIPHGVTSINRGAFYRCEGLTTIVVPDSVTIDGYQWRLLFEECKSLSQIIIPLGTRSKFEELLPNYKRKLIELDLRKGVTADDWTDKCGVMYSVDKERLLKATKDIEYYSIKRGTKIICYGAFNNCPSIKTVVIPDSVISVMDKVFSGCNSLKTIRIPAGSLHKFKMLLPEYQTLLKTSMSN